MKFDFALQRSRLLFSELDASRNTWEHRFATVAVIVQLLVSAITLALYWRMLPPKVPLWYSRPWGEERLGSPWFLTLLPVTALLVYGINRLMLTRSAQDHPMFARVLSLTSFFVSCISVIIVIRIVTLIS